MFLFGRLLFRTFSVGKESVCIDTYRVLDSCRDKDCFENTRVYVTEYGQEIIDHTTNVRTKSAHILWTCINVEPVQFNRGFYQVSIRFYVKLCFEGCVNLGRAQEFDGVAVVEKKVILYGSEGCVNIYRSSVSDEFCPCTDNLSTSYSTNMPIATVEVAAAGHSRHARGGADLLQLHALLCLLLRQHPRECLRLHERRADAERREQPLCLARFLLHRARSRAPRTVSRQCGRILHPRQGVRAE